jgi:hypothetical protein
MSIPSATTHQRPLQAIVKGDQARVLGLLAGAAEFALACPLQRLQRSMPSAVTTKGLNLRPAGEEVRTKSPQATR